MSDEDALLAGIAADPTAALPRLVYADWLDDHGDPRGELVRLEQHLVAHPADDAALMRFRELVAGRDPGWLVRFVRPEVARCGLDFLYACPRKWAELTATADPMVRHCDGCEQPVFLCTDRVDARRQARRGRCVAVDARLVNPDDLRPDLEPELVGEIAFPDDGLDMGMIVDPSPPSGFWERVREAVADLVPRRWR